MITEIKPQVQAYVDTSDTCAGATYCPECGHISMVEDDPFNMASEHRVCKLCGHEETY